MRSIIRPPLALCSLFIFNSSLPPAYAYTDEELIDGFNKTVFGSEYTSLLRKPYDVLVGGPYVRKFPGKVRFFVRSTAGPEALKKVQSFIVGLKKLIPDLQLSLVARQADANFVVHVVQQVDYAATVKLDVFKSQTATVRGRCMVRSLFSPEGISRSDAVIVADQSANLFSRCMTEEILQGLGPLNDDRSLKYSMFNDSSPYVNFRRFDRFILNMLYDKRIKIGASQSDVEDILPVVLKTARQRIEGGG